MTCEAIGVLNFANARSLLVGPLVITGNMFSSDSCISRTLPVDVAVTDPRIDPRALGWIVFQLVELTTCAYAPCTGPFLSAKLPALLSLQEQLFCTVRT